MERGDSAVHVGGQASARDDAAGAPPRLSHAHGDHAHPHDHSHGHAHDPALIRPPRLSLLLMPASLRLSGAVVLSALVWLGVWWATA